MRVRRHDPAQPVRQRPRLAGPEAQRQHRAALVAPRHHTGHRSVAMVRVYTRRADAFADHAGEGLL